MDLQPTLENDFILIRRLKNEDYEDLYHVAKDPLIWEQHHAERFKRDEFDLFFKESIESKGCLVIIDKVSKQIIGSSRFKKTDATDQAIEIGWSFLSRKYWGGKYNQAIKKLMIIYAFTYFVNVIFYVKKDNIRSQKAVEKIIGKKVDGFEYQHLTSSKTNTITYLITRNE